MQTTGNTVLVTGGGSGIGLAIARIMADNGNTVIITGRDARKLKVAADLSEHIHYIAADLTKEADIDMLVEKVKTAFGSVNMLINNAGTATLHNLQDTDATYRTAASEMSTNYLAVVHLTAALLPLLQQQPSAAIVNVSSVVALSPAVSLPTYSASKAALHAYTQSLRMSLADAGSTVKVFEVMPPLVDTELAKDIPSPSKLTPESVAAELLAGLQQDQSEICPGMAAMFRQQYFGHAGAALLAMNGRGGTANA